MGANEKAMSSKITTLRNIQDRRRKLGAVKNVN